MKVLKVSLVGGMGLLCYISAVAHSGLETYGDLLAILVLIPSAGLWVWQINRIIKEE